jgi:DNA repair protein RAD7
MKELVANKKMNVESFQAIAEVGIEALEIVDCAEVTQEQLALSLRELLPAGLRYLVLDQSGRCFGPKAVEAIISSYGSTSKLFALSIGGAYLLKDADAAKLLATIAKSVSSIEFKACPLLGVEFFKSVGDSFADGNLMELSLEDLKMDKDCFEVLLAKPEAFKNLKSLSLKRIEGLTDELVNTLLDIVGGNLERLDLSHNYDLTDTILAGIRKSSIGIKALNLASLKHLTPSGLQALFTHVPNIQAPPMLRSLDLGNCDSEAVTDDVIELITQAATTRHDGVVVNQLELLGGLVNLSIQGATLVSDTSLEHLVASSARTLQELDLSFCTEVTDQGVGYLVDKCSNQLSKIEIWGCAQLTDDCLDGHHRVDDPTLVIVGAWMKKNTSRTMR